MDTLLNPQFWKTSHDESPIEAHVMACKYKNKM